MREIRTSGLTRGRVMPSLLYNMFRISCFGFRIWFWLIQVGFLGANVVGFPVRVKVQIFILYNHRLCYFML